MVIYGLSFLINFGIISVNDEKLIEYYHIKKRCRFNLSSENEKKKENNFIGFNFPFHHQSYGFDITERILCGSVHEIGVWFICCY